MAVLQFDPFREFNRRFTRSISWTPGWATMPIDVRRDEKHFEIDFDLPGVAAEDVDLTVEKNVLTVKAERRRVPVEGEEVVASERPTGSLIRRLFLGKELDLDQISAHFDNGVLHVTVPVAPSSTARRIEIASGNPEAIEAA